MAQVELVKAIKTSGIVTALGELAPGDFFILRGDSGTGGGFYINNPANTFSTQIVGANVASDITFTLPPNTGNPNEVLVTDGNGVLSFTSSPSITSLSISGDLSVGGNFDLTGNITIGGNSSAGDANTDSLTISADISSDVIPDIDVTYSLGSPSKYWQFAYIDGLLSANASIGNVDVAISSPNTIGTSNGDLTITSSGGTVQTTGNHNITGNSTITGIASVVGGLGVTGPVVFDSTLGVIGVAGFDNNVAISGTLGVMQDTTLVSGLTVGANSNLMGTLSVGGATTLSSTLNVASDTTIDQTLTVQQKTNLKANVDVTGNLVVAQTSTLSGNVTFGANIVSNILPNTTSTYNIGSNTQVWKEGYFDTVTATNLILPKVSLGDIKIADSATNEIDTSTGNLVLDSAAGVVQVDDNLEVTGTAKITDTLFLGNWTIKTNAANEIEFSIGGTVKFKMDSAGVFLSGTDVTI